MRGNGPDPVLGRDLELAVLGSVLAEAAAGRGRLVLVAGPPGIGKSRLAGELAGRARDAGCLVGWGAAVADVGMPARWLWQPALRELPEAGAALDPAQRPVEGTAQESAAERFALHAAVVDALERRGRDKPPVLIVLEDLHWADQASLALLAHLVPELRRLPVLVLGTHRDAPEPALLSDLATRSGVEMLRPAPLAPADAAAVLADAAGRAGPDDQLRQLAERAGGNPLLLRTLGHAVATAQGTLEPRALLAAAPQLQQVGRLAVSGCPPETRAVVDAVAVLGAEVDPALLARVCALDAAELPDLLAPGARAGLLAAWEGPPQPVRFSHELLREVVARGVDGAERSALHRRAAEALEPRARADSTRAGQVAWHWYAAGGVEADRRAAEWALVAAGVARDAAAFDESAARLRMALDAIERSGVTLDRSPVLLDLARAEYHAGHLAAALDCCERAATAAEREHRPDLVAAAAVVVQGVDDPAINVRLERLCRRGLDVLGESGPPAFAGAGPGAAGLHAVRRRQPAAGARPVGPRA